MIRVNLLPRKREAKRDGSRVWIAVGVIAAVLELVFIVIVHAQYKKELDEQLERNRVVEASIADKKAKVANHEGVKKQLAEFTAREDAIAKLQAGRSGPAAMLIELSRILTPRKLPTFDAEVMEKLRRDNPGAVPNERWDTHRLWLTGFREDNRVVLITGLGKTNEDVAELIRRLTVSRFFTDVRLVRTEERTEKDAANITYQMISFDLRAKVRY